MTDFGQLTGLHGLRPPVVLQAISSAMQQQLPAEVQHVVMTPCDKAPDLLWWPCRVPVAAASIALPDGTLQAMSKTVDNYWLATSGPYTFPAAVSLTSVFGDIVTDTVNVASPTGAVAGKAQFPLNSAYETVGGTALLPLTAPACTTASPGTHSTCVIHLPTPLLSSQLGALLLSLLLP